MAIRWQYDKPLWGDRVDWDAWGMPAPVGEWWFNEGAANRVHDASGNGNHGTLTNMDPATDWVATAQGTGLDFDGGDDFVVVPASATLAPGMGDYTVWTTVKSTARKAYSAAMEYGNANSGTAYVAIGYTQGADQTFAVNHSKPGSGYNSFMASFGATTTVYNGTWRNLVGVLDRGATKTSYAYLDGAVAGAKSLAALSDPIVPLQPLAIGKGYDASGPYYQAAQLAVIVCWKAALSPSQVATLQGPIPIWQPQRYWYGAAAATAKTPLCILKAYDRRAS